VISGPFAQRTKLLKKRTASRIIEEMATRGDIAGESSGVCRDTWRQFRTALQICMEVYDIDVDRHMKLLTLFTVVLVSV